MKVVIEARCADAGPQNMWAHGVERDLLFWEVSAVGPDKANSATGNVSLGVS